MGQIPHRIEFPGRVSPQDAARQDRTPLPLLQGSRHRATLESCERSEALPSMEGSMSKMIMQDLTPSPLRSTPASSSIKVSYADVSRT